MGYLVGIDGGGTQTTIALADEQGRELLRRTGPAGLVDPRQPEISAEVLVSLVRQVAGDAGLTTPATALCAGLAGVGPPAERRIVRDALIAAQVAEQVTVQCDGEIALEGAFLGGPGILIVSGTGSIAHARAEDGRVERCGGWGMFVGDEGSGYAIGRDALRAALRAVDGRGPSTQLLGVLLGRAGLSDPWEIPSWAARVPKAEIAGLVPEVLRLGESGDPVACGILETAAVELALHAAALFRRLEPWIETPGVAPVGGVFRNPFFADLVAREVSRNAAGLRLQAPVADAVAGALRYAQRLVAAPV